MRKFKKERLGKLIFWVVHVVGSISLALGVWGLIVADKYSEARLDFADKYCVETAWPTCHSTALSMIAENQSQNMTFLSLGIALLLGYWVALGLYCFLFPPVPPTQN